MGRPTPITTRPYVRPWHLLLLATFALQLAGCSTSSTRVSTPAPPLPVRQGGPRATTQELRQWIEDLRVDLFAQELDRERAWADAMKRDGDWAE